LDGLKYCTDAEYTYITSGIAKNKNLPYIINKGLLTTNDSDICMVLRLLGNIFSSDTEAIDAVIKAGGLKFLLYCVDNKYNIIRRECGWALANLTADSEKYIKILYDIGVFPKIFASAMDNDKLVRLEFVWVINNVLTGSNVEMAINLIKLGVFEVIMFNLDYNNHPKILAIFLEGLFKLFLQGNKIREISNENPFMNTFNQFGGYEALEKLQEHPISEIYAKALSILETFYDVETVIN
jgi:importin subunit alpha-1